jgi:hypothetical protein
MMKPLYLTYTNGAEPYMRMAQRLCHQVAELEAGDCFHLCLDEPGQNRSFHAEAYVGLYPKITESIGFRPVIVLDADNELWKPIVDLFEGEWDIATVYRSQCLNKYGRQDYCSGFIALNNRRPNIVRKFWFEWIYRISVAKQWPGICPSAQVQKGWLDTWYEDQSTLNEIILTKEVSPKIGEIYVANDYRILPLDWRLYSGKAYNKGAFVRHHKGGKKK